MEMRGEVLLMLKAVLEKGQEYNLQYGEGWLQPVHLFGAVCNEEHRQFFAATLLVLMEKGEQLQEALATAVPPTARGRVTAVSVEAVTQPEGWTQEELKRRLGEQDLPTLIALMRQWGLWCVQEWTYSAITPPQSEGFAFTREACPDL
jgi:hypothetical protein